MQTNNRTHITSHAAGGVLYRLMPKGEIQFLIFPYSIHGKKTLRCPMGKHRDEAESPQETAIREVKEEIVEDGGIFEYEWASEPIIYNNCLEDERYENGFHLKIFFLIRVIGIQLRSVEKIDDTGSRGREILGIPRWVEAKEALELMMARNASIWAHVQAVQAGLVSLLSFNREVWERYGNFIAQTLPETAVQGPTPMSMEYLARFRSH